MIQPSDLHKVWTAPDNSRLTSKQYSFRLPVHVAAKLAALCEIYPSRTRTELVGDLLAAALADVERGFPSEKGKEEGPHPGTGEMMYQDAGLTPTYRGLVNRHYLQIEKALGNAKALPLYTGPVYVYESEFKDK